MRLKEWSFQKFLAVILVVCLSVVCFSCLTVNASSEPRIIRIRELTEAEFYETLELLEQSSEWNKSENQIRKTKDAEPLHGEIQIYKSANKESARFYVTTKFDRQAEEIGVNPLTVKYNVGGGWKSLPSIHRYTNNSNDFFTEIIVENLHAGAQVQAECTHYAVSEGITYRKGNSSGTETM